MRAELLRDYQKREDLKKFFLIKKKKERKIDRKNSKNISRSFSGFVVSIVGSVHFWLVP